MILTCNYEEVTALSHGARAFLEADAPDSGGIAAPSQERGEVEGLLPQLTGDLSFQTLAEQRHAERGVAVVVRHLRATMTEMVAATHPAAEEAVASYFDWAHALSVLHRLQELGAEMEAMVEVVTGRPPSGELLHSFHFPD
jgi:hypothetical protein